MSEGENTLSGMFTPQADAQSFFFVSMKKNLLVQNLLRRRAAVFCV
jgi:hypothetical protein